MLVTAPSVFAVGHEYQIMVPVTRTALVWVQIGEECYYDESNGIMRSLNNVHRVTVPMETLDRAGEYTLFIRPIIERKPYFTTTEEPVSYHYAFRPLPKDNIRIFQIADAHRYVDEPVAAARQYGDIDLLVLNGDILNHSGDPTQFINLFEISGQILGGTAPVVFSRGNHDLRGEYAERFSEYTPNRNGYTYYTFRIGSLWGLVLDCGEDKPDSHPEYGYTVACHQFRKKETAYIERVIQNAKEEYEAEGVEHKLVICHVPFTWINKPPFDIEQDTYAYWVKLLKENIHPDMMLCGHTHTLNVVLPGDEQWDCMGQAWPVLIGSKIVKEEPAVFTGMGVTLKNDGTEIVFADSLGNKETHNL